MSTLVLPATLVPGANENVNDLNSDLNAIVSWANGSIDDTNLAATNKTTTLLAPYQTIEERSSIISGLGAVTTFALGDSTNTTNSSVTGARFAAIHFDPADYAITGRTLRLRLRASVIQNTVAAAINVNVLMATATITGGASGAASSVSPSAAVTGSLFGVTLGGVSTFTQGAGTDFTPPAAGLYVLGVIAQSGTQAAGSILDVRATLQAHWI